MASVKFMTIIVWTIIRKLVIKGFLMGSLHAKFTHNFSVLMIEFDDGQ